MKSKEKGLSQSALRYNNNVRWRENSCEKGSGGPAGIVFWGNEMGLVTVRERAFSGGGKDDRQSGGSNRIGGADHR